MLVSTMHKQSVPSSVRAQCSTMRKQSVPSSVYPALITTLWGPSHTTTSPPAAFPAPCGLIPTAFRLPASCQSLNTFTRPPDCLPLTTFSVLAVA